MAEEDNLQSSGPAEPAPEASLPLATAPCPQCAEYKASWQRALADYQNLKKETEARRSEWAQYSEQMILEEFIPVYDNFKLAFRLQTSDFGPDQQKWVDGIKHIMKQFGEILKAHNVQEIKTAGEMFDPKFHETVGEAPSSDGVSATLRKPGEIAREVAGGYTMGGRVIKVAKVVIAK